jgi:hypothetical protein
MYFKGLQEIKDYFDYKELQVGEELMIFIADQSDELYEPLTSYLKEKNIKFFGGIYPGLLVKDLYVREGLIVNIIRPVFKTKVFPFLMKSYRGVLDNHVAFIIADGLSSQFKNLVDTVYGKYQDKVTYVGGGAGYYNFEHKPCVFDENGLYQDVMMIAFVNVRCDVHFRHGWKRLKGPYYVNYSYNNVISEIDYGKAFETYQDVFEKVSDTDLHQDDFFELAKDHPLGIKKNVGHDVVRDPIMVNEDNEIICVANIPEGSDIYILEGDVETLLNASSEVATLGSHNKFTAYRPFLFDCITRAMYLEDQFIDELINIQTKLSYPVYGALSIGEISSLQNRCIEIHNKSVVLAIMEDE